MHSKNIVFLKEYFTNQKFDWIDYDFPITTSYFTSGGGTHLYLVHNKENKFLARINFYPEKNNWGVKKTEFETLKKIESLDIAPRAFALSTSNSLRQDFTIVEYIEGKNVKKFEVEQIKLLAKDLQTLHNFEINNVDTKSNPYICNVYNEFSGGTDKQIEKYQFEGMEQIVSLYNEIKNNLGTWFNGLLIFADSDHTCLCHSDLKSENILVTPTGIKFIDWECADINIPETDIARLFSGCAFTEQEQNIFLSEYYSAQPTINTLHKILAVNTVLDFFRIIEDYFIYKRKPIIAADILADLKQFKLILDETKHKLNTRS